ncbi:hypothetical protein [Tranquillimonas alkanivorans]|uniref:Uncharacterized protein n=1 Tax=Tranquillimonas alkanivorans TaxID=441119 RepID=A0A1I5LMC4_9RHOB|nr:hypothetical protein [Tranquillimonas alkanivorans]SFO98355.1 hypothetical protein SAMN04488047_101716 [Tranquillimonas alkanivorans]
MRAGTLVPAALALAALPFAASAQSFCAERATVVERLNETYGESFAGGGLRNSSSVIEVWSAGADGTWTILMTRPDGISCIVAAGTNWRDELLVEPAKGVPG